VWPTIAEGKPSPRTEVIYNIEPFRGAIRQGDWKLIWRSLIPTSVDLFNIAEDPYEKNNLAAAHPEKVAAMQARINQLGTESAKPLALIYIAGVGLKHGKPLIASEEDPSSPSGTEHGHAITDEGVGSRDTLTPAPGH
jgi:arylsulfatase A-like enzyme